MARIEKALPLRTVQEDGHYIFPAVTGIEAVWDQQDQMVQLVVRALDRQGTKSVGRQRTGTTLEVRMDHKAATTVLAQLFEIARSKDWPLPK